MYGRILYSDLKKVFPDLEGKDYDVVVLGYTPQSCPYSNMVSKIISKHKNYRKNHKFIEISRGEESFRVKEDLGYKSTFPLVFLKSSKGDYKHIGGAQEFDSLTQEEETVEEEQIPSKISTKSHGDMLEDLFKAAQKIHVTGREVVQIGLDEAGGVGYVLTGDNSCDRHLQKSLHCIIMKGNSLSGYDQFIDKLEDEIGALGRTGNSIVSVLVQTHRPENVPYAMVVWKRDPTRPVQHLKIMLQKITFSSGCENTYTQFLTGLAKESVKVQASGRRVEYVGTDCYKNREETETTICGIVVYNDIQKPENSLPELQYSLFMFDIEGKTEKDRFERVIEKTESMISKRPGDFKIVKSVSIGTCQLLSLVLTMYENI
jgi:glutaredoxin